MKIKDMIIKGFAYPFSGSTYISLTTDGSLNLKGVALSKTQTDLENTYLVTKGYLDQINQGLYGTEYYSKDESIDFLPDADNNFKINVQINPDWLSGATDNRNGYIAISNTIDNYLQTENGKEKISGIIFKYNHDNSIYSGADNYIFTEGVSLNNLTSPYTVYVDTNWMSGGIAYSGYLSIRAALTSLLSFDSDNEEWKGFDSTSLKLTPLYNNDNENDGISGYSYGVQPDWLSSDIDASAAITSVVSSFNVNAIPFTSGSNNSISTYLQEDTKQWEFTVNPSWISGGMNQTGYQAVRAALTGLLGHTKDEVDWKGFDSDSFILTKVENEDKFTLDVDPKWMEKLIQDIDRYGWDQRSAYINLTLPNSNKKIATVTIDYEKANNYYIFCNYSDTNCELKFNFKIPPFKTVNIWVKGTTTTKFTVNGIQFTPTNSNWLKYCQFKCCFNVTSPTQPDTTDIRVFQTNDPNHIVYIDSLPDSYFNTKYNHISNNDFSNLVTYS